MNKNPKNIEFITKNKQKAGETTKEKVMLI